VQSGFTCKRCRKQAVTMREVRKGEFHEECGSCGHKSHYLWDTRTSDRVLKTCDCG
jgi:hypothetical protein